MFIDRNTPLGIWSQLYDSDHAELYVLYDRRWVVKKELLLAFCADKPLVFFIATLSSDSE